MIIIVFVSAPCKVPRHSAGVIRMYMVCVFKTTLFNITFTLHRIMWPYHIKLLASYSIFSIVSSSPLYSPSESVPMALNSNTIPPGKSPFSMCTFHCNWHTNWTSRSATDTISFIFFHTNGSQCKYHTLWFFQCACSQPAMHFALAATCVHAVVMTTLR